MIGGCDRTNDTPSSSHRGGGNNSRCPIRRKTQTREADARPTMAFHAASPCSHNSADASFAYPAPRYYPFPPFLQVLETVRGRCDLAGGPSYCRNFSAGTLMMPEPFVVQAIASTLAHCPFATTGCYAVDIGGNLGIHTAYMASLGAELDVVEAAADLAPVIERTMRLNCWADRVRVHKNAITANASNDGVPFYFRGGWRLDDRGAKNRRQHPITQIAIQRFLKNRRVDLIKIEKAHLLNTT